MQPNENSVGPVIAIIIVLAMVVLGGLYFWGERKNNDANLQAASMSNNVDETTASIRSQSTSDDSASIESDLNNTNTDSLDNGLQGI